MLIAPDGPDSWPEADSRNQWLVFYKLDQMSLNGTGTIEGNGDQWWDLPCKPHRVNFFTHTYTIVSDRDDPKFVTVKLYSHKILSLLNCD